MLQVQVTLDTPAMFMAVLPDHRCSACCSTASCCCSSALLVVKDARVG